MVIDMKKYKKDKQSKELADLFFKKFLPPVCDALDGKDINMKLYCAARLLHSTAAGIFHLNLMGYDDKKLKEEKKEYLKLLKELAEDVKDV